MNQAAPLLLGGEITDPCVEGPAYDLIEHFFFAYRAFVGDADTVLATYGFGRAHHRVLHFVDRQPGLTIAELLALLAITKQSLNRVLRELLGQGFIESRVGPLDRRQRLLFTTGLGRALAVELASLQSRRLRRALGPHPDPAVGLFLRAMHASPADEGALP